MPLYPHHDELLYAAITALKKRVYFAAFPENPKAYAEGAAEAGIAAWQAAQGKPFDGLLQGESQGQVGEEVSPYTGQPLGITYPFYAPDILIENANRAKKGWRNTSPADRAAMLIEALQCAKHRFFELAHATMHTTGQSYMMSFQASGPHAADRAMESIALGYEQLTQYPEQVEWRKPMGKLDIVVNKTFKAIPKGINLVIGCSTFPTWNTVPGLFAGLITGNTVIVKPHPGSVYPIAIVIAELQKVFNDNGIDPCVVQLAADSSTHLITKLLAEDTAINLIDYTGGSAFGNYIEALTGKTTFTEKAGINSVIIESCNNIDDVIANLSFAVSLYSGQMCTAPQNFFIPQQGIKTPDGIVSFDEFAIKFKTAVLGIATHPKMGAGTLGAIQNQTTHLRALNAQNLGTPLLIGTPIANEEYPNARTCSPSIIELASDANLVFEQELFGPIVLLVKCENAADALQKAKNICHTHGAITCAAYTTDATFKQQIIDEMESVFCPVSFNLTGFIWVNQHAAFSDFHVSGGNPAGNASFTNQEFICKRFVWIGNREVG